jgi:hypothetical protein
LKSAGKIEETRETLAQGRRLCDTPKVFINNFENLFEILYL